METSLIEPEDPRWAEALAVLDHDAYHLPGYVRLCAEEESSTPRALLVRDGASTMFVPLLLRASPDPTFREASTPYGYPAPLLSSSDPAFAGRAFRAAVDCLRADGVVSLFARLHPILRSGEAIAQSGGTLVEHGQTVWIDLTKSEAELWSDTRSGHRNEINRAVRAGHRAFFDDEWRHLDDFVRLYEQTMQRVGATPYYYFKRSYYERLRDALGPHLRLACVQIGEAIGAAALFFETAGTVQYHLSGMDSAFARERPTKLLLHHARLEMKARGNARMHLGGGVGAKADALFDFKAGFSSLRATFATWRVAVDPDRFAALCDRSGAPPRLDAHFPPWRATGWT